MFALFQSNIITQMNSVFVLCSSTFHLFIFCWFGERLTYEVSPHVICTIESYAIVAQLQPTEKVHSSYRTMHLTVMRLLFQSNMLAETIYECPWYALKNREKRVLLMILARSQRPIKLNVLGFYDIGLSTFTAVLWKFVVSYH